ncbi:MAG: hypothetical protein OEY75_11010 [Hylemonella sp.]|nr:hypothetical protein [Hylemonella sp.]MDH5709631.1 hypothetical protein [Hylemonella sp.]
MDLSLFLQSLLTSESPLLPPDWLAQLYRALSWGLVLATAGFSLLPRKQRTTRWGVFGVLLLWNLWPGPVSPAYWLGLAFQSPSLASSLLCVLVVGSRTDEAAPRPGLALTAGLGVVLGWLLLLDTLALLPLGLYALGFSPAAVVVPGLVAAALWLSSSAAGRRHALWLAAVLTLYVLTRLPNGNLWDALLDPWLWLMLQFGWLWRGLRWLSVARRGAAATRA